MEDGEISDDSVTSQNSSIRSYSKSSETKHKSSDRYKAPDRKYLSSDTRSRSPGYAKLSSDTRSRSPGYAKLSSDTRSRSPGYAKVSSDTRSSFPAHSKLSSDTRSRSPGYSKLSSDTRSRSPGHSKFSSDTRSRSPVHSKLSSDTRSRSPGHSKSRKRLRTPDSSLLDSKHGRPSSSEHRGQDKYKSGSDCHRPSHRARSPKDPYYRSKSPGSRSRHRSRSPKSPSDRSKSQGSQKSTSKRMCRNRSRSPRKSCDDARSTRSNDDMDKNRYNSPMDLPSKDEFEYVISQMKTEKDDTPIIFNRNFEDAIEKEFISEVKKAMFYLTLHFQVIIETKFDKVILDAEDKKKIKMNLQNTLKNRFKKLTLNRFMLEMDIVALYKSIYKLKDDTELIQKFIDDVTYVEIIDDPADPPPVENVDRKMWHNVDQVLEGLDMNMINSNNAQTLLIDKIKEEHVLEEEGSLLLPDIKIKTEPETDGTDIPIKIEKEDIAPELTEPPITIKTEPLDQGETPAHEDETPAHEDETSAQLHPYIFINPNAKKPNQPPVKKKKKHVRKIFEYPDITKKPIPDNPQFYITTKNVVKQMSCHIPTVSEELDLCLNTMDMVIVSDLMKAKLRKKIKKLLKNKTYMRSPDITKLFREHHPKEVDKKFVKKVLKSFKKGPKPPKASKHKIKEEKKDSDSDEEVKVVEQKQEPITLDDNEMAAAIAAAAARLAQN